MENERSSLITIGGEQYEMILTTRATKAISTRYGGLDNLGNTMLQSCHQKCGTDAAQQKAAVYSLTASSLYNLTTTRCRKAFAKSAARTLRNRGERTINLTAQSHDNNYAVLPNQL